MPEASRCPVCGGAGRPLARCRDLEYFTSDAEYVYALCERCPVVFLVDPPVDRLGEIYPSTYYSYSADHPASFAFRLKESLDLALFRRVLNGIEGERLNVLDVGGGTGRLLTLARRASPRVAETHEVDFADSARPAAESAGHVFHPSTIEDLQIEQRFHLVLLLNLLEHVADPRAVFHKVRSLLAPGGVLLLKTPSFDCLDFRLFRKRNWGGFHCPRHFVLFTPRSLRALAEECGLACERVRHTQGAPQWTASILGELYRAGWIRLGPQRPQHLHPLYGPLLALTAALDLVRLPFAPTAQMIGLFRRR